MVRNMSFETIATGSITFRIPSIVSLSLVEICTITWLSLLHLSRNSFTTKSLPFSTHLFVSTYYSQCQSCVAFGFDFIFHKSFTAFVGDNEKHELRSSCRRLCYIPNHGDCVTVRHQNLRDDISFLTTSAACVVYILSFIMFIFLIRNKCCVRTFSLGCYLSESPCWLM